MSQKVIICKGLPASGKTFFSKNLCEKDPSYVRVNRDDLRNMRGKYWLPKQEDMITIWENRCIAIALEMGQNVIVDSTNLNPKHLKNLLELIENTEKHLKELDGMVYKFLRGKDIPKDFKIEIEYADFTTVPLKECIKRDLARPNSVGEKVIRRMYYQYIMKNNEYKQDPNLPHCIIVDLDGTLALFGNKNPFDRDFENDEVNYPVLDLVLSQRKLTKEIFLFSGRNDKYKTKTITWLLDKCKINVLPSERLDGVRTKIW